MNPSTPAFNWSEQQYAEFGLTPQVLPHSYHELPLSDDQALADLLDSYPRTNLQAHTMGDDPAVFFWKQVNIADDTTGAEILEAVKVGRYWLNLTHIEKYSEVYGQIIDAMYAHLGEHCAHLENPQSTHSALLISSPRAQVYYHLDAEPNMLWHLRGQKHLWMYPAMNMDIVPQDFLEGIYAGEIDEDLPYRPEFDELAVHYLLNPGDAACWPHNAPHRIVNIDVNVSLATAYMTPSVYQRQYIQLANRYLLRELGFKKRSMAEVGLIPSLKRFTYRALNRLRPFKRDVGVHYLTDLELDPAAPMGMRTLSEPVLPEFARPEEEEMIASPN